MHHTAQDALESTEAIPVVNIRHLGVYLSSDDMTDLHKVVIDDTGKMIRGPSVRLE